MPAVNHLFEFNKMARNISEDDVQIFHTIGTKLLFLVNRTCPKILTGVEFLTMIFRNQRRAMRRDLAAS